jgi:hypothetical protein
MHLMTAVWLALTRQNNLRLAPGGLFGSLQFEVSVWPTTPYPRYKLTHNRQERRINLGGH